MHFSYLKRIQIHDDLVFLFFRKNIKFNIIHFPNSSIMHIGYSHWYVRPGFIIFILAKNYQTPSHLIFQCSRQCCRSFAESLRRNFMAFAYVTSIVSNLTHFIIHLWKVRVPIKICRDIWINVFRESFFYLRGYRHNFRICCPYRNFHITVSRNSWRYQGSFFQFFLVRVKDLLRSFLFPLKPLISLKHVCPYDTPIAI